MPKIGFKFSEKSRKKMSLSHLGKIPWSKGKKFSKAYRKKLSKAHKGRFKGSQHPGWKGGITYNRGYVYVYNPNHPFCDSKGYVRRSHLVMEKLLGRFIPPDEHIHHINGIKDNDRPKNLRLFKNNSKHAKFHNSTRKRNNLGQFIS